MSIISMVTGFHGLKLNNKGLCEYISCFQEKIASPLPGFTITLHKTGILMIILCT